jgi:sugar lactone lactonase YvrE
MLMSRVLLCFSAALLGMPGLGWASPPKAPKLAKVWECDLPLAETVAYDPSSKILYATGMGEAPNSGVTWKISLDGKVLEKDWATGLNQVRGSKLVDGALFIAELQSLAKVDLATGKVTRRYQAPQAAMFNNIAVDEVGNLYITDTPKNAIYKYSKDRDVFEKWLETPALEWPNGILFENDKLILAPWGTVTDPKTWATDVPGRIQTLSISTKEIKFLAGNEKPLANGDGLVGDGKGNYFVGDWMSGNIYLVNPASESVLVATVNQGMGDFFFIPEENLFLVPVGKLNKLFAFRVN